MKHLGKLGCAVATAALTFCVAAATPTLAKVSEFDANGDEYVDMEEFRMGTEASFQSNDADGDRRMSRSEFEAMFNNENGEFASFDGDGNGFLTNDEFDRGIYSRYDQDGDGRLDVNESGEFDATIGAYVEPRDAETIIEDTDKLDIKSN